MRRSIGIYRNLRSVGQYQTIIFFYLFADPEREKNEFKSRVCSTLRSGLTGRVRVRSSLIETPAIIRALGVYVLSEVWKYGPRKNVISPMELLFASKIAFWSIEVKSCFELSLSLFASNHPLK